MSGAPDPREPFELRAWARARLWRDGEIEDLHDAVDELQVWAERIGLVGAIGQDAVQAIMAAAFAEVRDDLRPAESEELVEPVKPRGIARSTLDAAEYLYIHKQDPAAWQRFLDRHSIEERDAIIQHLQKKGRSNAAA
jgi:hypothetical protein